jgi:hypothetical protein
VPSTFISSAALFSSLQGLGTMGYLSSVPSTFISSAALFSSLQGLGSLNYISSTQLTSTAQGLTTYVNSFIDPTELASSITGLGTVSFISSIGLLSTSQGLANYITTFIDPLELASTVTGLGTTQYVSTLGLVVNTTSTLTGLGTLRYISSTQLTSTTLGLGTIGYVSSTQLTSTTLGLGTLGYISTGGVTQTQVTSSIRSLLVPYSTLDTTTYFNLKASTNQLLLGTNGLSSQIFIGDLKAAFGDTLSTDPLILINQPIIQQAVSFSSNYPYTGSDQTLVIPAGVTSINVTMRGAGGGSVSGGGTGGTGAFISGTLAVTPGQTLTIIVGQAGSYGGGISYGGGGTSGGSNASGGGRSAIQISGNDIVTAGAGGGAGGPNNTTSGGNGGYPNGADIGGYGGKGGTQTSSPNNGYGYSYTGGQYIGGPASGYSFPYGGGGGGGYYGGSAGFNINLYSGGGGGSSYYTGSLTNVTANSSGGGSTADNNGTVLISYNVNLLYRNANALEIRGYQGNKMIVDPYMNMGIGVTTINSTITLDVVGTARASTIVASTVTTNIVAATTVSTQQLLISSINGQTFGAPITSTMVGLGTIGYVSSTQLVSTVSGLQSNNQLTITSTVRGLGTLGYLSSAVTQTQITSSITNLLVPYSTLNSATYFNVKASTNQLFFGTNGPQSQLYIGDIGATFGDRFTTYPTVLINQPVIQQASSGYNSFTYSGGSSNYVVPAGVTSVTVILNGAGGGYSDTSSGGAGGYVSGTLAVTPGQTLVVIVGQAGVYYGTSLTYGGGGKGNGAGASGGGRSAIQLSGNDIVTAGGGGGATYNGSGGTGGSGGYTSGTAGTGDGAGGAPGTTTAGGTGTGGGSSGTQYQGGNASTSASSGGGGGGYYGGAGGGNSQSSGGGGSSYYSGSLTNVTTTTGGGASSGNNGSVTIFYNNDVLYRNANPLEIRGFQGNKMIIDAYMNMGIGVSSINSTITLDVVGTARATSVSTQQVLTSSINVNYFQVSQAGTTNISFNVPGNSNQSAWFNNGIGKFGIGKQNPDYTLDVAGSLAAISSTASAVFDAGFRVGIQSTNDPIYYGIIQTTHPLSNTTDKWSYSMIQNGMAVMGVGLYPGELGRIVIGTGASVTSGTTNGLTLNTVDARLGIANSNPTYTLDVNGTTRTTLGVVYGASEISRLILGPSPGTGNYDYCSLIQSRSDTANNYGSILSFFTHGTGGNYGDPRERITIDYNGYVGISCNTPYYELDVNGTINAFSAVLSNGVALSSDRRIKKDIIAADLSLCYNNFLSLPLRRFQFISSFSETKNDKSQIGFIADEISTFFPRSIYETRTSVGGFSTINSVNYEQIQMSHYGASQYMAQLLQQQNSTLQGMQNQILQMASVITTLQG